MILRRALETLAAASLLAGAGCTPTHLVFYQSSVMGLDVATSADSGTVHATLGYDRQTGTIVPKTRVKANGAGTEEAEAMAVVSRTRITVRWFRPSEICERFATGEAARNVARQGAASALSGPATTGVCEGF